MSGAQTAASLKASGNKAFQNHDYLLAESYYTRAITHDPSNAALFTNRALARIRQSKYVDVLPDCESALELDTSSLKAYTFLGQAHLALDHPESALKASKRAYELAIAQKAASQSLSSIVETVMKCKKAVWEAAEKRRLLEDEALLRDTIAALRARPSSIDEDVEDTEQKVQQLMVVFARNREGKKRDVPEWLLDQISFGVMMDPVITKNGHSYEKSVLLDHLRRSKTDPLTREPLDEGDLRPNLALKAASEEFLKENGWAVDW